MFVVCVVCCEVEISATSWSLVERSPTDCGASLCVIKKLRGQGGHSPRWTAEQKKIINNNIIMNTLYRNILLYFMLFWPYISIYACNETTLVYYLSAVYFVTTLPHVSGLLVAQHQKVTMYMCNNKWYVLYFLVDCQLAWSTMPADSQLKRKTRTHFSIHTLLHHRHHRE
jgi:hypothetical protein